MEKFADAERVAETALKLKIQDVNDFYLAFASNHALEWNKS